MKVKFILSAKKLTNAQTNAQFPVYFGVKEGSNKVFKLIALESETNMPKAPFRKIGYIDTANMNLKTEEYTTKQGEVKQRTLAFVNPADIEWVKDEDAKDDLAKINEEQAKKLL